MPVSGRIVRATPLPVAACALLMLVGCSDGAPEGQNKPASGATKESAANRETKDTPEGGKDKTTPVEGKAPPTQQEPLVQRLLEVLNDREHTLERRVLAAEALGRHKAKAAIPRTAGLLEEISAPAYPERPVVMQAVRLATALGSYGADAEPAVAALSKAVNCGLRCYGYGLPLTQAAMAALGKVATPTATAELQKLFGKNGLHWEVRVAAVSALAEAAAGKDEKFRQRIVLELQVIAATDENREVRVAAEEMAAALRAGKEVRPYSPRAADKPGTDKPP